MKKDSSSGGGEFILFYDGLCPVCRREVAFLKAIRDSDEVSYVDIASSSFDASRYGKDITYFVKSLRGFDGEKFTSGMDTMRALYRKLGLGFLMSWTALPGAKQLTDFFYHQFSRVRPKFSRFECDC